MDVLLTDLCARALIVELAAENTDEGILEILDGHQEDLIRLGSNGRRDMTRLNGHG